MKTEYNKKNGTVTISHEGQAVTYICPKAQAKKIATALLVYLEVI